MSLKSEMTAGVMYSAIGKYSNVVIQLVIQAILSRILTPAEYGIVAVVNVFLVFFQMLVDFGIGPAIIQNRQLDEHDIESIFSFSVYFSVVLAVLFIFCGKPISLFYGNPVYVSVVPVMSLSLFFGGLSIVPQNMSLKHKEFKFVNINQVAGSAVNGIVSVVAALWGCSYYAIIFGNVARALFLFIFYYLHHPVRFKIKFALKPLKKIYHFTRNQFLFNFINYFSRNLDNILIGRYISSDALAFYDKAYQISLYPNQILTSVITPVIQPILSEYQKDQQVIKITYLRIVSILGAIGLPLSVFVVVNSSDIIHFLFGSQWSNSVVTLQILGCSIWLQMILSTTGGIFQSGNRTDLLLTAGIFSSILNVTAIVVGVLHGHIESVASLLVVAFTINFIQANYLLFVKMFHSRMIELVYALAKPFGTACLQAIVFILLPTLPFDVFVNLILKGLLFVVVWLFGLFVSGQWKDLFVLLGRGQ